MGGLYLASRLVEDLHVHGTELRAATAPAEAGLFDCLVNMHPGTIADLVPVAMVHKDKYNAQGRVLN